MIEVDVLHGLFAWNWRRGDSERSSACRGRRGVSTVSDAPDVRDGGGQPSMVNWEPVSREKMSLLMTLLSLSHFLKDHPVIDPLIEMF